MSNRDSCRSRNRGRQRSRSREDSAGVRRKRPHEESTRGLGGGMWSEDGRSWKHRRVHHSNSRYPRERFDVGRRSDDRGRDFHKRHRGYRSGGGDMGGYRNKGGGVGRYRGGDRDFRDRNRGDEKKVGGEKPVHEERNRRVEEELEYQRRVEAQLIALEKKHVDKETLAKQAEGRRALRREMFGKADSVELNGDVVRPCTTAAVAAADVNAVVHDKSDAMSTETRTETDIESVTGTKEWMRVEKTKTNGDAAASMTTNEGSSGAMTTAVDDSDEFDMFATSPSDIGCTAPLSSSNASAVSGDEYGNPARLASSTATLAPTSSTLADNWDDPDGYYRFRAGDMLGNRRYQVFADQGRGVFSSVLRVWDLSKGKKRPRVAGTDPSPRRECVIKVIRNKETMLKAGQKELLLLKQLAERDPQNRRHVIRLLSSFEHRGHLCMVFEPMSMNLREVIKKFGSVGIGLQAVRIYAAQLFTAAGLMRECNILHGDIKPDNLLVNKQLNILKVCDLGSAGRIDECEITPYLVSRFYRSPEIIIGHEYNEKADIWSIGCVLFELYTGRILFPGRDNNDMLRVIQEVKGPFPGKMLRKGMFSDRHFDAQQGWAFQQEHVDPVTNIPLVRVIRYTQPSRSIYKLLRRAAPTQVAPDERKKIIAELRDFADMLERCFVLQPQRRLSVDEALQHKFFSPA